MSVQMRTHSLEISKWTVRCPKISDARQRVHSIAGRLGISVIAELAGCWFGGQLVRLAARGIGDYMAPPVFSFLNEKNLMLGEIVAMTALALRTQDTRKQMALGAGLAAALTATHVAFEQYPNWTKDGAESFGKTVENIGALLGENLGGFIGLTITGIVFNRPGIVYWDRNHLEGCYAVGMGRYQAVGVIYNQIINPQMMILKPPCAIGAIAIKTAAYNSDLLIPFFGRLIALIQKKESSKKILEPLVFQMISRRFFKSTSEPLGQRRLYLIFSDLFEEAKKIVIARVLSEKLAKVGADQLVTRLLLKSFRGYVSLVKNDAEIVRLHTEFKSSFKDKLQEDILISCLKQKVSKSPSPTQAMKSKAIELVFSDDKLKALADRFIKEIGVMEKEFWGFNLLTQQDEIYLQKMISIHLKFFLNYMCLHFSDFIRSDLEIYEDMELVLELNHLILSGYFSLVLPKSVHRQLDSISHYLSTHAPDLRRKAGVLIHRSEQSSRIDSDTGEVNESYCPIPDATEAKIMHLEKEVRDLRNRREQSSSITSSPITICEEYYDSSKTSRKRVEGRESMPL